MFTVDQDSFKCQLSLGREKMIHCGCFMILTVLVFGGISKNRLTQTM